MNGDLGIYSTYKTLKRRQDQIDKAIDRDLHSGLESTISPQSSGTNGTPYAMNPLEFQKYQDLIKKLQIKENGESNRNSNSAR